MESELNRFYADQEALQKAWDALDGVLCRFCGTVYDKPDDIEGIELEVSMGSHRLLGVCAECAEQ